MKVNEYKEIGLRSLGRFFTITHFMQGKTHLQIGSEILPNASGQISFKPQLSQLFWVHFRGGLGHQAGGFLGFGEGDHIPD